MNPKDMTDKQLLNEYGDSNWAHDASISTQGEILRRLDESDVLRKENEELRKDKEKLLKDYAELRVNSALLVACDDVLEALELDGAAESKPQ